MDLLQIRDEAWSASQFAHSRIREEWRIYHNNNYEDNQRVLQDMVPRAKRSLNPMIQKGILRLVSPFMEQAARMEVQSDRSDAVEDDIIFVQDLNNWLEMMESADNETETLRTLILHNLVSGMSFAKTYFDPRTRIMRSEAVHPLSIAVDGGASRIDLSDAMCVAQQFCHDEFFLRRHYDWVPKRKTHVFRTEPTRFNAPTHRLDELWIRRDMLEDCTDVDSARLENDDKQMFRAVLIDDEVVEIRSTPFWWPDFPFAAWRNFSASHDERKAQDFWGFGYGTLLSPQQMFLDEMLATLVAIARNMPTGQAVVTRGTLDREQQYNLDGQVIELAQGKDMTDFQKLPIDQIPPVFGEMISYISQVMQEQMPSLSEVFTGESPGSNSSGRAIASLQFAAFTQLSANLKEMNEFRKRRVQQRLTGIQQTAKKPLSSHIWRGGLDLPDYFPEEPRYIGFDIVAADASSMPHSPAGKLEVVQALAAMGYVMPLEEMLKFVGFDTGYGLTPDMFQQMPMADGSSPLAGGVTQMNMGTMMGTEAPLP